MSIWDRLFGGAGKARPQASSGAGPIISSFFRGQPIWTPRRYDRLADEGFIRNAIGYRCTKLIAEAAASLPWLLYQKKAEVEQHPLLDLLARPAPMIGGRAMMEALYAYVLLEGNTYLEGVAPFPTRPPLELWNLRPDRMKAIPGAKGLPEGYQYEVNGQTFRWDVDQVTGRGPIFHLREFHPLNDWYGLSRVEPAAYGIDQHNEAGAHNKALLQNGARPSGALAFKPIVVNGQQQHAPDHIIEKAEKRLEERHAGSANAGRPMVLGGNVDWLAMGLTPRDMDFNAGRLDAARDICTSFGVPHVLIVPGQGTFNNRALARLELYEDTVLPLAYRARDQLNAWLTARYGDGYRLDYDVDAVPALEPRRESKRKGVNDLWTSGLLKRDEARGELGFDAIGGPEGEEFHKGAVPPDEGSQKDPEGKPDEGSSEPDTAANAA